MPSGATGLAEGAEVSEAESAQESEAAPPAESGASSAAESGAESRRVERRGGRPGRCGCREDRLHRERGLRQLPHAGGRRHQRRRRAEPRRREARLRHGREVRDRRLAADAGLRRHPLGDGHPERRGLRVVGRRPVALHDVALLPPGLDPTRVRAVFLDLDGTIVNMSRAMPAAAPAIARLEATGVRCLIATGRMFVSSRRFAEELGVAGPIVCYQGALVGEPDGTILEHHPLDAGRGARDRRRGGRGGLPRQRLHRGPLLRRGGERGGARATRRAPASRSTSSATWPDGSRSPSRRSSSRIATRRRSTP